MQLFYEHYRLGEGIAGESTAPVPRYDPAWRAQDGAVPLSTSLSLGFESWGRPPLVPWRIKLLLKDSDAIRMMVRIRDALQTDVLVLRGRVISGAMSLAERGATGCDVREVASNEELERVIDKVPRKPFLAGEDDLSMSLSGVQKAGHACAETRSYRHPRQRHGLEPCPVRFPSVDCRHSVGGS